MVAPRYLFMLACASLGLSGCASLQDLHYSVVNKTRAEYSWYSKTSFSDRWSSGSDYAYGYKSGYYDAATGKGCALPPVPPPCYWSTKYQCCEGQKHIQDWYRGYQCGVAAAQGSGYPSFHDIPLGPQAPVINKDGCGACYSPTGCLCEKPAAVEASLTDMPAIPHLASSSPSPGSQLSPPIFQVSATSVSSPTSAANPGLIGPFGAAAVPSGIMSERAEPMVTAPNPGQPNIR